MNIPDFMLFGGATMSRVVDGHGAIWRGCCAVRIGDKASFGFYIFRNGVEIPYTPFCTGRGCVTQDGYWTAWNGTQYFEGVLPGFVPQADRLPLVIRPGGAIAQLWHGTYTPADLDTPADVALRLNKLLAALNELIDMLM